MATGTLLVQGLPVSPPGVGRRVACRQANSLAPDSHMFMSVDSAKEELRLLFSESAIRKLERSWQDAAPVTDLAQLMGVWQLQVPKMGQCQLRSWMVRHGAPLSSVRLKSSPEISISADGHAQFRMQVGYPHGVDEVRKPSNFEIIRPNVLKEFSGKVTTGRISVNFPSGSPTDFRVTYLDDELMIHRDSSGSVAVYWRTESEAVKRASERAVRMNIAKSEETMQANVTVVDSAGQRAAHVVSAIARLEKELKEHQTQLDQHAEQRLELTAQLADLDRQLVDASTEVDAGSVQLRAVEVLRGQACEQEARQKAEQSAKAAELEGLNSRIAYLTERKSACLSKIAREEKREASLREQVLIIPRAFDRSSGKLHALSNAKKEMKEVQREARALRRDEATLSRALQRALRAHEQQEEEAKARATEQARLEVQLQARCEELRERKAMVSSAAHHRAEICRQRNMLLAQLRELDRCDDAYKAEATDVEKLLDDLLTSAKRARSTALCVQRHGNTIWPWDKA